VKPIVYLKFLQLFLHSMKFREAAKFDAVRRIRSQLDS